MVDFWVEWLDWLIVDGERGRTYDGECVEDVVGHLDSLISLIIGGLFG